MDTTTAPTARGIAFLATHPQLLDGAYAVSVYEYEVKIQGQLIDMADTMLALRDLDSADHVTKKRIDEDGNRYTNITGIVDGIHVELVAVTPAARVEAVTA